MKSLAWYDLQVIICSAIMMSYYFIVLRNKKFHQYNRFYMLAVFFLSFLIPLIKIQLDKMETQQAVVQFIYVLADYNAVMDKAIAAKGFQVNWDMMAIAGYVLISAFFLFTFVIALFRIRRLLQKYSCSNFGDVYLILTNVKGTPFSFFRYIFWNEEIDLQSSTGQQILQHELTHVKEKHSIDNIIIQVMMVIGWFNPFFWIARKELQMIHEFIADKKSVDNGDAASLAEMLLTATYPQQQFLLTNSFFFSPIKRRLIMITNNKNPRFSYMRRVIVLPLMVIVVLLFAFRMKQEKADENKNLLNSLSGYTEMAQSPSGKGVSQADMDEYEAILKKVIITKELKNGKTVTAFDGSSSKQTEIKRAYAISLAMSAEQKEIATKVNFLKMAPAKRTVPTSAEYEKWKNENQYGVWIDDKHVDNTVLNNYKAPDFALYYASNLTGAAKAGKKYNVQVDLYTEKYFKTSIRKDTMIVITKRYSIPNESFGKDTTNPTFSKASVFIVNGERVKHDELNKIDQNTILSMNVLKGKEAVDKYGKEGENGAIEIKLKPIYVVEGKIMPADFDLDKINKANIESVNVLKGIDASFNYGDEGKRRGVVIIMMKASAKPMYVIDGIKILANEVKINPNDIFSMNVLKDEVATSKYGDDGKNGVIEIVTKNAFRENLSSDYLDFLKRNKDVRSLNWSNDNKNVTVNLNDGTSETYLLWASESKQRAIDKYGVLPTPPPPPSAKPVVTSVPSEHPLGNKNDDNKVFTNVQVPAEFPGGLSAWQKYLERNLNSDVAVKNAAPAGKYIVFVSFIVNKDGTLRNITSNDSGYGTAEEAIRVISKGPNWIPAKQNGENVASVRNQGITFVVGGK